MKPRKINIFFTESGLAIWCCVSSMLTILFGEIIAPYMLFLIFLYLIMIILVDYYV